MSKFLSIFVIFALWVTIGHCGKMKSVGKWLGRAIQPSTPQPPRLPLIIVMSPSTINNNNQFKAVAVLRGNATGTITFSQRAVKEPVTITGEIRGLTPGQHGIHIAQKGNLTDGCLATGDHFNPKGREHGSPTDKTRHIGDLGNIIANSDGVATVSITDNKVTLLQEFNVIGRSIVVTSGMDDLGRGGNSLSKLNGNSGDRVACGVIGIA